MSSLSKKILHIKLLHNSIPIGEVKKTFKKNTKVVISNTKASADIFIPNYNFNQTQRTWKIITPHKKKIMLNVIKSSLCFLKDSGKVIKTKNLSTSIPLTLGSGAVIYKDKLAVLVSISKEQIKKRRVLFPNKLNSAMWSNFFSESPYELKALLLSLIPSFLFIGLIAFFLSFSSFKKEKTFSTLSQYYTLPFISPDHLETEPEALQSLLDRTNYIGPLISYYQSLTYTLLGFGPKYASYTYQNSAVKWQKRKESRQQRNKKIKGNYDKQAANNRVKDQLIIPTSYLQEIHSSIKNKIKQVKTFHKGLRRSVELKKKVIIDYKKDAQYAWTQYIGDFKQQKTSGQEDIEELSRITVFGQATNEDSMYNEANKIAQRARNIQKIYFKETSQEKFIADDVIYLRRHSKLLPLDKAQYVSYEYLKKAELSDKNLSVFNQPILIDQPADTSPSQIAIQKTIAHNKLQLNVCYQLALKRNRFLKGELLWKWEVSKKGLISNLVLSKDTLQDEYMLQCVRRTILTWNFPPIKDNIRIYKVFKFDPKK